MRGPARGQARRSALLSCHASSTSTVTVAVTIAISLSIDTMPASPKPPADSSTMLPRLQAALRAFQASHSPFALIPSTTTTNAVPRKCTTLVVLDSSFNPPTIAHMAMATSALHDLRTRRNTTTAHEDRDDGDGVRLLLLLAVNNADKAAKPASFEQRLLMMQYFAGDLQRAWRAARARAQAQAQQEEEEELPVDIGLTTLPYFHDKSAAIAQAPEYTFAPSGSEQVFLAGYDTLIRIFHPKYYTNTTTTPAAATTPMQAALDPFLARARLRITMRTDAEWGGRAEQEEAVERLLQGDELTRVGGRRAWAERVEMVEGLAGEDGLALSSTEARAAVAKGQWERVRKLVPEGVAGAIERGEVQW